MKKITRDDIFKYVEKSYGTRPEYLWARSPEFAVLRRSDNNKWYGIIMNIPRKTLKMDGDGLVDIINVKCDTVLMGMLLGTTGYRPAYHMSKSNWISIVLDGSVPRDEVLHMIKQSYELVGTKTGRK